MKLPPMNPFLLNGMLRKAKCSELSIERIAIIILRPVLMNWRVWRGEKISGTHWNYSKVSNQIFKDIFPFEWKVAKLVLISKGQIDEHGIPKARPICLLDKIVKTFERIIMLRIQEWLTNNKRRLLENQFSFHRNHSTIDALQKVTRIIILNWGGNC